MSVMVTDRSRFAGAVAGEAVAVACLPGAGAGGVVVAPPVGPGLAGTPTLVGGAAAADPGVMVRGGAAADVEAVLPVALVKPGRGGRTVLGAPAAVDGLLVVDVPVPAVAAAPVGAAPVVPVDPGLAGTLVGGEAVAGPGVMVRVGAPVDGEAVLPGAPVGPGRGGRTVLGAPAAVDGVLVVDVPVSAVAAAPVGAAPVVPVDPGLAGMPVPAKGGPGADPGVMVRAGTAVDGEAVLAGAPVGTVPVAPVGPGLVGTPALVGGAAAAAPGVIVRIGAAIDGEAVLRDAPVAPGR
jgi:hypothetical protein